MPASAGIVSAPISAPKRGVPASIRRISAASAPTSTAPASTERLAQALGVGGRGDQVDAVGGADGEAVDADDVGGFAGVLAAAPPCRRSRRCAGRSARGSPAPRSTSATSTSRPILYICRWRRAASSASGSVSSQISSVAVRSTRMSACMWPLRSSSAAYWPSPRRQRLDVVGQLPLQVLGRVGPADDQLAALGAIEQPALLAQLPVLGIQLDVHRIGHLQDSRKRRDGRSG